MKKRYEELKDKLKTCGFLEDQEAFEYYMYYDIDSVTHGNYDIDTFLNRMSFGNGRYDKVKLIIKKSEQTF